MVLMTCHSGELCDAVVEVLLCLLTSVSCTVDLAPLLVAPPHHRHELLGDVVHWQQASRGGEAVEGDGLLLAAVVQLFAVGGGGDGGGEVHGGYVLEGT